MSRQQFPHPFAKVTLSHWVGLGLMVIIFLFYSYHQSLTTRWIPSPALTGTNAVDVANQLNVSAQRGQFGDMFGGLTSMLSALSVLGLAIAIAYQRTELRNQQKELKEAAEDREEAAKVQLQIQQAMERQAEALKQAAAISALSARISIYNQQIEHVFYVQRNGGSAIGDGNVQRMSDERHSLIVELDKLKESTLRP